MFPLLIKFYSIMTHKVFLFPFIALLFLFTSGTPDNSRTVTGKITDISGEEIIGVSIQLKNSHTGTMSDVNGRYSLSIPQGRQTLVFSFLGFNTQEIVVEPHVNVVNVTLQESAMALEEVVVTGYGTLMKGVVAGVITRVETRTQSGNKKGSTWKRSGMPENSIRLEVGDGADDFLPLQAAQMAVQVDGFRVRVLMDCFFFNDKADGLEGTFKLRLPVGASPYYFAFGETEYLNEEDEDEEAASKPLKSNKKQIPFAQYDPDDFDLSPEKIEENNSREWESIKEARIVSKQKAARAYEATVNARIDPALMEWAGADFFTCRVFPLSKGRLHRVVIGYDLNMIEALHHREYVLTLPAVTKEFRLDAELYDSPESLPVKISPQVATHREGNHSYFSLHNPKQKEYTIQYPSVEPVMLTDEEQDYFAANFRIQLPEIKQDKLPTDAVFLFDVSLSSQPDKFNVWLKLMEEILSKNKDIIRRFSVLCFNIETFWWNRYYLGNNYYNLNSFLEYANTLALEGATDLGSALEEASHPSWLKTNTPKHIFVMSDADFNWGESNLHALKTLIHADDRIHTYKTGLSGTNAAALDYLSNETGGFSFTVTGEEEAELTARSFRYRPWRIEEIQVEGVEDFLISGQPSQLYNGQKLIFGGRGKPAGDIYIRVHNGIETKELHLSAKETIASTLAKRVYGQLALNQLESYSFQTEEATESYATYFRIPNATMSFLMLESQWDYYRFGIDEDDAGYFVRDNTVQSIIEELLEKGGAIALGDGKSDFIRWLNRLKDDEELEFSPDALFNRYLEQLPDEIFNVKFTSSNYRLRLSEQQTDEEKMMLADDNILYDNLLPYANRRKSTYGKADALKLLSSVIERNPGDFIALRDLALKSIEWNLGDQAYSMMRRIIANRQYEALAYLTAADALAQSGHIEMALIYYYICLHSEWDSDYGSFREIAALQCLRFIHQTQEAVSKKKSKILLSAVTADFMETFKNQTEDFLKSKDLLIKEADVVIIINWNTNNTDVDLHVFEPTGEECYYGHRNTEAGGQLTIDVTEGYGPEMYVLKNAVDGKYRVSVNYYSDDQTKTSSKSKIYLDFYRNWGRAGEKVTRKTILLEDAKEMEEVLQFEVRKTIR